MGPKKRLLKEMLKGISCVTVLDIMAVNRILEVRIITSDVRILKCRGKLMCFGCDLDVHVVSIKKAKQDEIGNIV